MDVLEQAVAVVFARQLDGVFAQVKIEVSLQLEWVASPQVLVQRLAVLTCLYSYSV